jgi:hypothetical protein
MESWVKKIIIDSIKLDELYVGGNASISPGVTQSEYSIQNKKAPNSTGLTDEMYQYSDEESKDDIEYNNYSDEEAMDNYEMNDHEEEQEDENKQGMIRIIPNAHLVYKRKQNNGYYEELWIYNIGDLSENELKIKHDILSGTDIDINQTSSNDNTQSYKIWSIGNAQLMNVRGLPN